MPATVEKVPPILQFSLLCDGIAQPKELNGKLIIIGVFHNIIRPSTVPQMFVVSCWTNGIGIHKHRLRILKPDLSELFAGEEETFDLKDQTASQVAIAAFVNFDFPVPGVYWIQHFMNGEQAISYPLPVFDPSSTPSS